MACRGGHSKIFCLENRTASQLDGVKRTLNDHRDHSRNDESLERLCSTDPAVVDLNLGTIRIRWLLEQFPRYFKFPNVGMLIVLSF